MKFAYFGTPSFSTKVLDALEERGLTPALVVTAPDKRRGRGLEMSPSPVQAWALERRIDVLQPVTLKQVPELQGDASAAGLSKASPPDSSGAPLDALYNTDWDVFVVAAYAKLLPQAVLDIPRRGCLNVHPSLLPKFRGASPVVSAILSDERETGVSIMEMTADMDTGPLVAQAKIEIAPEDWPPPASVLTELLFTEGGNLLAETLPLWMQNKIDPTSQDDSQATFTKKFAGEDALLCLSGFETRTPLFEHPREAFLKIRAFDKNPRAYFYAERGGKKIRVIVAEANWQDGKLVIEKVIPEGKKEMAYKDFSRSGIVFP